MLERLKSARRELRHRVASRRAGATAPRGSYPAGQAPGAGPRGEPYATDPRGPELGGTRDQPQSAGAPAPGGAPEATTAPEAGERSAEERASVSPGGGGGSPLQESDPSHAGDGAARTGVRDETGLRPGETAERPAGPARESEADVSGPTRQDAPREGEAGGRSEPVPDSRERQPVGAGERAPATEQPPPVPHRERERAPVTEQEPVPDDQPGDRPVGPQRRASEAEARRRERFGGFNVGAAFFGWLVAVGLAVLLTALVSAAGAAVGLTTITEAEAARGAGTIGIVGGVLLLVVLLLAYYAGGYVAGRMSRFDGGRQGFGVWVIAVLVTLLLALLGTVLGAEYNVLQALKLPRIPVGEPALTTNGIIVLAGVLVGTLLTAVGGGKAGERYHAKVDRAGPAP
jgi:hypothetical protein